MTPADATWLPAFERFGLGGMVIATLVYLIIRLLQDHRAERDAWAEVLRQNNEALRLLADSIDPGKG